MTSIIINVSPSVQSIHENLSSMQFAQNARSVRQQLKDNVINTTLIQLGADEGDQVTQCKAQKEVFREAK